MGGRAGPRRSTRLVPEREHPAEEAESRPLAPAVFPAPAPDRSASLLHVADQRGSNVEASEKQQAPLEHAGHVSARPLSHFPGGKGGPLVAQMSERGVYLSAGMPRGSPLPGALGGGNPVPGFRPSAFRRLALSLARRPF
jgi:hypothetical protein